LLRHQRVHTGELRYCCDVCNKTFRNRSRIKIHLRVHTVICATKDSAREIT
jgi:KRAB domain-containing zinc finger protein